MKKKLFFIAIAVLSVGFFTSCEDDEIDVKPSIEFIAGTDMITADATVEVDQDFTFKYIVTKGSSDLEEFTIRVGNSDLTGFPKTDIDDDLYQDQLTTSIVSTGIYDYTFIATDKNGLTETITITVTAVASAGVITTYTDKLLGSYSATEGSSFASVNGNVYNSTDAATNSDKVDLVYFYGATNYATFAAPSDSDAQTVFSGISAWTTKNATVFGTTAITATAFDAMTDDSGIVTPATGLTSTKISSLEVNDVIAFETASTSANASKKGLIKITDITGTGGTGTITFTVKVQE